MSRDVLITGGLGYVGSMLTEYLLARGVRITVVDLGIYWPGKWRNDPRLKIYRTDIRDANWEKILDRRIRTVVHLAAISNDPGYGVSPQLSDSINYLASVRLFDACAQHGVRRFIFPSSCSVYGRRNTDDGGMVSPCADETSRIDPLTEYAKSKSQFEHYILSNNTTMDCVILRPSTIYGFSYRQRMDLLVNRLAVGAWYGDEVIVPKLSNIRPALFMGDIVRLYYLMIFDEGEIGGVYNISGDNLTILQTGTVIEKVMGKRIKMLEDVSKDSRSYAVSTERLLKRFPSFQITPLEKGLQKLAIQIKKGAFKDYKENEYYYNARQQPVFFGKGK